MKVSRDYSISGATVPYGSCTGWFRRWAIVLLAAAIMLISWGPAAGEERFQLLGFKMGAESKSIPDGWKPLTYLGTAKNEVLLRREDGRTVLRVNSLNSASGLLKSLDAGSGAAVDIGDYPNLLWRWKVNRSVGMAIESRKDRNDCAARVRVIFGRSQGPLTVNPEVQKIVRRIGFSIPVMEPSGFKIDYVWGARAGKGEVVNYPGSQHHKMIVVERGNNRANRWLWEQRNLADDFRRCFDADPPGLAGIVILTDTDQTNEGVEAWYSSIVLMKK